MGFVANGLLRRGAGYQIPCPVTHCEAVTRTPIRPDQHPRAVIDAAAFEAAKTDEPPEAPGTASTYLLLQCARGCSRRPSGSSRIGLHPGGAPDTSGL